MGLRLEDDEVVVIEYEVFYGKELGLAELTLTNKNIVIQQEKGLFFKRIKVVDKMPYSDIKVYKNKARVLQNGINIVIEGVNGNLEFASSNVIEGKKITEKIITIMTDKNIITRTGENALKVVKGIAALTGVVATGIGAFVAIRNNKIQILDALESLSSKFKNK